MPSMRRSGLISTFSVVANLGDSAMRARLAKGTLDALGANLIEVNDALLQMGWHTMKAFQSLFYC